jgi:tRNA (guanine26-N2/guanine27-N2)-dimethyltransferase
MDARHKTLRHEDHAVEFPTITVEEGMATLLVPKIGQAAAEHIDRARSQAPVFFNPTQKTNRDSAVLALGVHQKRLSRRIIACEPMCGTGARGIRLALEVDGVERVILGDLNPLAVDLSKRNASVNGVSERVEVRLLDANLLLSLHARPHRRLDYVDIDPYGTPTPFLDTAVRACKRDGLMALTATDMAPLCGVNTRACLRKYGGRPLRTPYCHELALRLLTGALVSTAARHGAATKPVFSYAADHYVRLYSTFDRGARKADKSLDEMGHVLHCFECSHRKAVHRVLDTGSTLCDVCGSMMRAAGPLWLGDLAEPGFCDEMLEISERSIVSSNRRLMEVIKLIRDEVGYTPGFYNVDGLCSRLGVQSLGLKDVMSALGEAGFKSTRTHIDKRGVKTDASVPDLERILLAVARGMAGEG